MRGVKWRARDSMAPITVSSDRDRRGYLVSKRLVDITLATAALALFAPAGLLIALLIKLEDGGSVFYDSKRIGRGGRALRFFKFRTMVPGADRMKDQLMDRNERKGGPLFKMARDPRVTRVGRVLRRHSLDEVPQFASVLVGTMSLVGPRPHLAEEVAGYAPGDELRLSCRPGIVGLPQVSRMNRLTFREWIDLDLAYVRRRSWYLDASVLGRTVRDVLRSFLRRRR